MGGRSRRAEGLVDARCSGRVESAGRAGGGSWGRVALVALVVLGCAEPPVEGPRYGGAPRSQAIRVYRLAVHPLHNPTKLTQAYGPLVDHLNAHLDADPSADLNAPLAAQGRGAQLELEASRDYASFEQKYRARGPELLLPNPWQTLQAMRAGYRVIAMAGEPRDFRGLILVRKQSAIRTPADLKGKAVSYPAPTALAACVMPQDFLRRAGLDVLREVENRYVGSQESSIRSVVLGITAAGATWPPPWRAFQRDHPAEAAVLRVAWETEPLVNNSVMARDDVPPGLVEQVRRGLVALDATERGRAILAGLETARFLPASDRDYDVVRAYVERFEREVRRIDPP